MRRHFGSLLFVIKAFAVYERGSCLVLYDTGIYIISHWILHFITHDTMLQKEDVACLKEIFHSKSAT